MAKKRAKKSSGATWLEHYMQSIGMVSPLDWYQDIALLRHAARAGGWLSNTQSAIDTRDWDQIVSWLKELDIYKRDPSKFGASAQGVEGAPPPVPTSLVQKPEGVNQLLLPFKEMYELTLQDVILAGQDLDSVRARWEAWAAEPSHQALNINVDQVMDSLKKAAGI